MTPIVKKAWRSGNGVQLALRSLGDDLACDRRSVSSKDSADNITHDPGPNAMSPARRYMHVRRAPQYLDDYQPKYFNSILIR